MVNFNNEWDVLLAEEMQKEYYQKLRQFLKQEYSTQTIYPDMHDIFNALKLTTYSDVKAVIIGQDPYHNPGQAHGLSFSVRKGVRVPPSLKNIYKEILADTGIDNMKAAWRADLLGKTGSADAQYSTDCKGTSGKFP